MAAWPTYSGGTFDIENPRVEDVNIVDIANSLSRINRYLGHTPIPYTVAQHSVRVSNSCPRNLQLQGLLHDAAEAYVGDIISPVKTLLGDAFRDIEQRVFNAIADKFGIPYELHHIVKRYDYAEYLFETACFHKPGSELDWVLNEQESYTAFSNKFCELIGR